MTKKRIGPDVAEAHYRAGAKREKVRDFDGAEEQYSLAILRDSKCFPAFLARGTLRWRQKKYAAAAKDLTRAILLDSKSVQAFALRGSCNIATEDYEGAVNDYTKALLLEPNEPTLLSKRAQARIKAKDPWGAIEDATRAIEEDPAHGNSFYYKGLALEMLDDHEGAEEALRTAKELGHGKAMEALINRYGGL